MDWVPHVTVACVVERDGKFLCVEEQINGGSVINQPSGHWERGETLIQGAVRETLEETGWDVEVQALLGVYEFKPAALDYCFLRFAFIATALQHYPERPLDTGIERALWLTPAALETAASRHRSPMVMRGVNDYRAGRRFPLDLIAHLTPSP